MRDVATADRDHQVARASDPGHGWRRLIPDGLIGHMRAARSDRIGHHGPVDSRNRILAVAADVHHDRFIGLLKGACEFAPEVSSAGIKVRLKADHDATPTNAGASSERW